MNDKKNNIPLDDELLAGIGGGSGGIDCGLQEIDFPKLGKCFQKSNSNTGVVFQSVCPHCCIVTSMPEGVNLEVSYIFDCTLYGYAKRIKEE